MTRRTQPTIKDVAREAGVSSATVSRVLNGTAPVHDDTRGRILDAIAALGYEAPQGVRHKWSDHGIVAVFISDLLNPFFSEVIRGIEEESDLGRYGLLLYDTAASAFRSRDVFKYLAESRVTGVIACAAWLPDRDLIAFHEQHDVPIVVINRPVDHPDIPIIMVDFENAAYRATQHLLDLHHTRIAYLADYTGAAPTQARQRGIERALREAGLQPRRDWFPGAVPSVEGGFQTMASLLASDVAGRPTAVIAYNDTMALGALHAIRTHGLRVPEDISVVGFDGIPMATHANPPLTTIDQPKYRMGRLAMQTLMRMIDGATVAPTGYTLMESPLVIRQSTGPASHPAAPPA